MALMAIPLALTCSAQSTHMMMPEGSKDIYLSLALVNAPDFEGSARRHTFVAPLLSAEFSNGVFVDMNTVGIHLSDNPQFGYGLQLAPTMSRVRVQGAHGWESKSKFTPEVGAFLNYKLMQGVQLRSRLLYGGSADHRGLRLHGGASFAMPVAEHHALGMDIGATLANRSALQADFAVLEGHADAALPLHGAKGGMRDSHVTAFWVWQLSTKYTLRTMLRWNRLHGSAAASPRTERAGGTTALTALTYQF